MEIVLTLLSILTIVSIFLFTLDDLFLDFAAFFYKVRPQKLEEKELDHIQRLPQKRFAILIANWKEEDVLERMIRGNIHQIDYEEFSIFLGVYPNDAATWEVAKKLEQEYSQVSVIVNSLPGPTSKGQLLNEMVRQILKSEEESKYQYDAFLLHDSEDLIHPLSLFLINDELNRADFVQVPVFSLKTPYKDFTAGTYCDEFAESHTKNLLVRERLGAAVPSAGVGTAVSRTLVHSLHKKMDGNFLNESTLTEDYQLGLLAHQLGYKTHFSCRYMMIRGKKDFIATREFFPDQVATSVRQKTRWTAGIAFQGTQAFGWSGNLADRYFLWRDRRGPLNGILMFMCSLLVFAYCGYFGLEGKFPSLSNYSLFSYLLMFNLTQMFWRVGIRIKYTKAIYGWKFALLVPLRWPLANYINLFAAWHAFRSFRTSTRTGKAMVWVKTQHRLPASFGVHENRSKLEQPQKGMGA